MNPRPSGVSRLVALRLMWAVAMAQLAVSPAAADEPSSGMTAPIVTTRNMQLVAQLNDYPNPGGGRGYNSCWGYVHEDGREYAVLGARNGTVIYNITDPAGAYEVAFIPGPSSTWRGMRAYRNWIYVVTEGVGPAPPPGLQIIRMTDPEHPVLVDTFTGSFIRAHTISVDTTRALLFLSGSRNAAGYGNGIAILSVADPENPLELTTWPGGAGNNLDSLYTHDSIAFGNLLYASSIYIGTMRVLDIADPANPILVSSFRYPGGFTHSSAPDTSGRYHYICDEAPAEPVKVFDVSHLEAPKLVNQVAGNPNAVVHNAHVEGDTLYLANFSQGVRLFDISDPEHPAEFAWADQRQEPLGFYYSVWNVCPYFPSRSVIASDMENGLFVYRPVRDFGILRVEVVDAGSGEPLAGATITLVTQGDSLVTPASGVGRFAPNPGIHTVEVRAFGYATTSTTRSVAVGERDTLVVPLAALPSTSFTGVVRDRLTHEPLGDAEIHVHGTPLHAHTDDSGAFAFAGVPLDGYEIEVHRPGYAPLAVELDVDAAIVQDLLMSPAPIWDALEAESGWVAGSALDDASAGAWVRVDPIGSGVQPAATAGDASSSARSSFGRSRPSLDRERATNAPGPSPLVRGQRPLAAEPGAGLFHEDAVGASYPHAIQPEDDRTPAPGTQCFVTGQGTVPEEYWAGNVDGGQTTLVSAPLDLTGMAEPWIAYWRWFYSDGDGSDWMAVAISADDGVTWTEVDTLRGLHNEWEEHAIRVGDFLAPSAAVRLRFEVVDGAGSSLVEGAVDDLIAYDAQTIPLGVPPLDGLALRFRGAWPTPGRGPVQLALEVPRAARISVQVLDLAGRRVRTLDEGQASPGRRMLEWNGADDSGRMVPPGLYFVRAQQRDDRAVARIVRLR